VCREVRRGSPEARALQEVDRKGGGNGSVGAEALLLATMTSRTARCKRLMTTEERLEGRGIRAEGRGRPAPSRLMTSS